MTDEELKRIRERWENDAKIPPDGLGGHTGTAETERMKTTLERRIGSMILSLVRWADDLGLRLDACIHAGMIAQQVKAIREEAERAAERR